MVGLFAWRTTLLWYATYPTLVGRRLVGAPYQGPFIFPNLIRGTGAEVRVLRHSCRYGC